MTPYLDVEIDTRTALQTSKIRLPPMEGPDLQWTLQNDSTRKGTLVREGWSECD